MTVRKRHAPSISIGFIRDINWLIRFCAAMQRCLRRRIDNMSTSAADHAPSSIPYWSHVPDDLLRETGSTVDGLNTSEAKDRLQRFGANSLKARRHDTPLRMFLSQFTNPLVLILIEMIYTLGIKKRGPTLDAVYLVSFF